MELSVVKGNFEKEVCDVLVLYAFQTKKEEGGVVLPTDIALKGLLTKVMSEERFKGGSGQALFVRTDGLIPAKRVLILGLGKKEDLTLETIREATAVGFQAARSLKTKKIVLVIPCENEALFDVQDVTHAMTEGVRLAAYTFSRYKKQKKNGVISFVVMAADPKVVSLAKKGMAQGELFSKGTLFARDLVNTPAHHMRPIDLVDVAKEIAKKNPAITVRVFGKDRLEKMGAGGILGVAQGSEHAPYMVHMIYKPSVRTKKRVALVGKAVTFDSGGLSLKPADYMMTMKQDMAGAASVLGAFCVMSEISPKLEVHGIFAAVENMPSGKAIRPGDVLVAMNKKTVEVLNTDAEGRLTLMDTLCYAQKQKPNCVIDLATLTGACVVALGEEITGVMSNDQTLTQKILFAAKAAGENMWELPLEKSYKKLIKSTIADIQNIGGRYGGALTAGLFLQEFVDPKMPWAHLDIAGPAFAERDINTYTKKGATGHAVRTLLEFLQTF